MKEIIKICEVCGKEFTTQYVRQKYCSDECRKFAKNEQTRQWNQKNPDRPRYNEQLYQSYQEYSKQWHQAHPEYNKQWHQAHKEQNQEYKRKWKQIHKEEIRERDKQYRQIHSEQRNSYSKKWRQNNPEKYKDGIKRWRQIHPEKCSIHTYEREKELDSIPLNKFFEGCEGHHIDKTYIIYIPKEIHHSISHNVFTGKNMDIINALAFNYLGN